MERGLELMRSLLVDRFGFPAERTRTLRDEEATQQAIRAALAGLAAVVTQKGATWRDVFEQSAPRVTAKYGRQHPQIEGRLDELLFDRFVGC